MLRIRGLTKRFGDLLAVADLDLDVARGECFGLLGPNGAGKTTTLACAIGTLQPDGGEISLCGKGPPADRAARRSLGVAPQSLAIYTELTGAENVRFFGSLQGLRGRTLRAAAMRALAVVGLEDRAKARAGTYSGGMQRRLNLACALVHDPELLLLDEPTAGVDPQSRAHLLDTVRALQAGGTTIVYTTHYMEEAEKLCDRVAIVDHGRLLAVGPTRELVRTHGGHAWLELDVDAAAADAARAALGIPPGTPADRAEPLRVPTPDPGRALIALRDAGVAFRAAHVRQPDLETVFLRLTGRELRDR
ncbi:MAG: ABC transporter ATP-binding protein [Planctomycetes bacterium]|nr:ABC transporter ATP-binding protein [Planctomycetota bacterium]